MCSRRRHRSTHTRRPLVARHRGRRLVRSGGRQRRHWCANGAHSPSCSEFRSVSIMRTEAQSNSQPGLALRVDHSYERLVRLDDILEHGRCAQHPSRTECTPRQICVLADERVETGKVFIEHETCARRSLSAAGRNSRDPPRSCSWPSLSVMRTVRAPRATGNVVSSVRTCEIDAVRRQLRDPMRHDCACEIDPLAAGATER